MSIGNKIKQLREENNMTQKEIAEILEVEPGTISKYESNLIEPNIKSLKKLSDTFQISVDDLIREDEEEYNVSDIDLLATFKDQKERKVTRNIYQATQVIFAYNSNRIEGNELTEYQVKNIYESNTLNFLENSTVKVNDIFKIANHFTLFDYMCDNANKKLTSNMVNTFYDILESGTFDDTEEKLPSKDMDKLLSWYDSLSNISFEKIVEFLVRFEKLKPFKNDNGIIGRMIIYKECLKNDIFPFNNQNEGHSEWKWQEPHPLWGQFPHPARRKDKVNSRRRSLELKLYWSYVMRM